VRARPEPQRLQEQPSADRARIRREAAERLRRRFARRRLEAFVETLLGDRDTAPMFDLPATDDEDYVRLLYLASYGLDTNSTYRLLPSGDTIHKDAYGYPDGVLRRNRRSRRSEPGARD
jgi:hypothetical protein